MVDENQSDLDGPVVFRTFGRQLDAELVANMLRDQGVEAVLRSDDAGGTYPSLAMVRGVKVIVRRKDLERAELILQNAEPVMEDDEGGD